MHSILIGPNQPTEVPSVAVVVDVMRAFTTAAWAFARGADRIVLARSDGHALAAKAAHPDWVTIRDGAPVPGFDLANSPGRIAALNLTGRTLVMKTTAGTVGALAVAEAGTVVCTGFATAAATAAVLRRTAPEQVTFVVTGDNGTATEDLACAQYIAECVADPAVDPEPFIRRARHSHAAAALDQGVRRGYQGVHRDDVRLCLQPDEFAFAMIAQPHGKTLALHAERVSAAGG
ncbi:2-phosphosulfolactate phosphatase [Nocardia tengchongensis]|uniref:Probable 2-phosphosulfolactate phosphatase n=1 Tax=Nocardia tengchongensis TaxID=2055889 RepID=A0ABX8CWF7_9NOCA|nr:2-phosphosulfolactate phosphatase [Nocardia tengchongensis]QVI23952.1 2-phosphosulfolactate phosphatase [Nocardia tengchongensis]